MHFTAADIDPPTIVPINDTTAKVLFGSNGKIINWEEPHVDDNSGTATLKARTHSPGDFFPVGITHVTYIYADPSGNTANMTFNVDIIEKPGKVSFILLVVLISI